MIDKEISDTSEKSYSFLNILSTDKEQDNQIQIALKKQELQNKKIVLNLIRYKRKVQKLDLLQRKLNHIFNVIVDLKARELIKKQDFIYSKQLMQEYIDIKNIQNKLLEQTVSNETVNKYKMKTKKNWILRKIFPFSNQNL